MTVGILGGGQLGRMLALAGLPLGLRFRFLDPAREAAVDELGERVIGEYEDYAALADFVRGLDCVTYEFENVPGLTARWLADRLPVFPAPEALEVAQDRVREKTFFADLGVPVPRALAVGDRRDLDAAVEKTGLPAVLKTRRFGYDGKGQHILRTPADMELAWARLGGRPLIAEQLIAFDREVSIIAVRGRDGSAAFYPLVENHHRDGILHWSIAPAPGLTPELQCKAEVYARRAMDALGYVGVMAIEFFEHRGELLVNEMAPRVHNSGHWTIEGAVTSQFENHLRAGLGWPLGDTRVLGWAAMINLIGTVPEPPELLAVPGSHLHYYGKTARPGRKLGHVTVLAEDSATLRERVNAVGLCDFEREQPERHRC